MLGVFPDADKVFGSFDEFFAFAPGGMEFSAGYAVEGLDGGFSAFGEFRVILAVEFEELF